MHILVNAISAKVGGIATYTRNLIKSLHDEGISSDHYVSEIFDGPKNLENINLQKMKAADYGPLRRLFWEQTVWRFIISRSKASVVFSSANYAVLFSPKKQLLLLREGGLFNPAYRRHILSRLGFFYRIESWLRRQLMLISANHASIVMVPSETMRDWILSLAPALNKKILVNLYGSDLKKFAQMDRPEWRADGVLRLLYVSVYYPHKDPLTLVRATSRLNEDGVLTNVKITMNHDQFLPWQQGQEEWDEMRAALSADKLSLGAIEFDELSEIYGSHDIMVFPSISETFGHPLVESMAAGIPIIASDTLTNREICGPAALYFPAYDAEKLKERILALDQDPTLRAWLVERGRERAQEYFQWNFHVSRLIDIFSDLANENRSAGV